MDQVQARAAVRLAVSRGVVQQQALKAIKPVAPKRSRNATLKALAGALAENAIVMDYLHEQFSGGQLGYHTLEDLLGGLLWNWRSMHDVPESGEWEDSLSTDSLLKSELEKKLKRYTPQGAEVSGVEAIDFGDLDSQMTRLENAIRGLGSEWGREKSLRDAKDQLAKVKKILDSFPQ